MSSSIPLQLVDDDELQALEVAIAAAEFSASSSKRPKISSSQSPLSSSNPPCNYLTRVLSRSMDLSSAQAPNQPECLTEALAAENRAPCSTSLHGSEDKVQLRSPDDIAADGPEQKPFCGGVSNDSSKETCLNFTRPLEIIQADEARLHKKNAGHAYVDICEASNGVFLHPDNTDKSSPRAPLHEDALRKRVSSRRLPSWPCPSARCLHESSRPSGHSEIRQTTRHRVDNELASSVLDLPDALCANNSRLPWGLVPRRCAVRPKCKLPSFQFKGQINYSDTVLDAENAANELLKQVEAEKSANGGLIPLGFDTEWKAVFKRGAQRRKVALLQLCIDADKCNVFHVIHSGIPSSLKSILEDPMVLKVGVGAYGDAEKLWTDYNVKVKGVKDLSGLANLKRVGCANKSWSLSSLAEELLGKQVDKTASIRTGDWEVEKLSEAQLTYAATDAFASLYLFQVLVTFPDPQ